MCLYERYLLPGLINLACSVKPVQRQRQKVVPLATGRVLEVGMGSGINLDYYDPDAVELVWGLEPSEGMRRTAAPRLAQAPVPVRWLEAGAEDIPLQDASVDTVLLTYTLCTIPDWRQALAQMRRVLKPGGRLLFCEHGAAPDAGVRRWQSRINPLWKRLAGGCNLDRAIPDCLTGAGFVLESLETMYLPATPRIFGYNYWGVGRPG